jgi:hypothetical protein
MAAARFNAIKAAATIIPRAVNRIRKDRMLFVAPLARAFKLDRFPIIPRTSALYTRVRFGVPPIPARRSEET